MKLKIFPINFKNKILYFNPLVRKNIYDQKKNSLKKKKFKFINCWW